MPRNKWPIWGLTGMDYKVYWKEAFNYDAYMHQIQGYKSNESSSSFEEDDTYIAYTKLSYARMRRLNKTAELSDDLSSAIANLNAPIYMLAITESWCGDAGQCLPYFNLMAEASDLVNLRLVYREEQLKLMDRHLTNGGRSIPKVLFLDDNFQLLGTWGPRPAFIQKQVIADKKKIQTPENKVLMAEEIQNLYNKDAGKEIIAEVLGLLRSFKLEFD